MEKNICKCITESLCCTVEIDTTLKSTILKLILLKMSYLKERKDCTRRREVGVGPVIKQL